MSLLLSQTTKIGLFFLFFFSYSVAITFTKEEQRWIKEHPMIKVGVDSGWEPFDFINVNGEHDGMSADYLQIISKKTGLNFVIEKHEKWSDVLEAAQKKQLDMLSALAPSKERSKYLNFTEPYMKYAFVLASSDSSSFFYEISDFNGKRIGVIDAYITEDILKENYPEIEVVTYKNLQDLLEAIISHEIDAIFDNAVSIAYHIKKEGYSYIKMVTIGEHKRSITMGVTKDNNMLLSILNKALKSITTVEKSKIRNRWVTLEYEKTIDYTLVYKVLALFLFFVLGTWYWYRKLNHEVQKRKESEDQMSMMIDAIPLNVIVSGFDGSVLRSNAFALQTFSIAAEDIYGYNVMEFYASPEEREDIIKVIQKEGRVSNRIVKFRRFDNSEMDIMISIIPIVYDGKKALLSIMVDLTERIQMEQDLHEAKEEAISANKSKSEFLANMSHEIRTPMNAIMGFTELLDEEVKETRLKGYVKTIRNAGSTLLTLINDILDLSKIEAGKLEITKRATNVYDLSEEVLSIFMMSVRGKDVNLILNIDENIPKSLLLDDVRLRQVLVNIIGNAVKFTQKGYIKLHMNASNVDDHLSKMDLEVIVEDTGMGINENQIESIFQSFEQQSGQDNRKYGGTGLGLSISKRLTEMMNGKISAESTEGKGSKFFLHFYNIDISSVQVKNSVDTKENLNAKSLVFKVATILVVDDIKDNLELIVQSLENTALNIITACDGYEALEQYSKEKPDLILMDIRMPNMDGYEAAEKIKALDKGVPIVALTASVMKDEYEQKKSKDFDAYLRKPVLRDELFLELSHFLAYDIVKYNDEGISDKAFKLSKNATLNMTKIVDEMHQVLSPLHLKAKQSNNIIEIKIFVEKIHILAQKYELDIFEEYASKFDEALETFDITQMQALLNEYPAMQEKFELL